jgi:hypothetical protein
VSTPKPKNKGGRPKLDKVTVSIRLSRNVLAKARQASKLGGNLSAWIQQAIEAQLSDANQKS